MKIDDIKDAYLRGYDDALDCQRALERGDDAKTYTQSMRLFLKEFRQRTSQKEPSQ